MVRPAVAILREAPAHSLAFEAARRHRRPSVAIRRDDSLPRQQWIYSLTEPAIQLVPLLVQVGAWGRRHGPVSPELSIRARLLEEGGAALWSAFMDELRTLHLGAPVRGPSVLARLQVAYEGTPARGAHRRSPVCRPN